LIVRISPSSLKGTITAPASKSSMQRACAAALLSKGSTIIKRPGTSNDDIAAIDVINRLGAQVIKNTDGSLTIHSQGVNPVSSEINCGESGLGIRMFTPLAALSEKELRITGTGSLVTRPMDFFDEILPKLQVSVKSSAGKLPLIIKGPLQPANIEVDGALSSQFLTGLLMAYGAAEADGIYIDVRNLTSKPYINLTLHVMKHFGINVENKDYKRFYFKGGGAFTPCTYTVEGDWSGAAFLLVGGAVAGNINVKGLNLASAQADKAIIEVLEKCGADIKLSEDNIEIGPGQLAAFEFDATDCPDLFPPLVALASYCKGTSQIKGVSRLSHKESDRGLTLQDEFGKMGITIDLNGDEMRIEGGLGVKGASVHSRHDHRIAMACAIAGLKAKGETEIAGAEAVNKSYPSFFEDIMTIGAIVERE
jgi:3-phosphoshikimate 1-carboxyvinyltransferase